MTQSINSTKYQDIVKTAHNLFWKHGIRRVSIEEICNEAKVSKMTFYRFFPNKKELAQLIMKNIFDEVEEKYRQLMCEDIPFEAKIKKQIAAKFEGTREISLELIKDIYTDKKLGLHVYVEERSSGFAKEVLKDYAHAQEMGWMRKDIKLDFIMYFISKMAEIVYDPQLGSLYATTQDIIMEITNLFFYGILPPQDLNE